MRNSSSSSRDGLSFLRRTGCLEKCKSLLLICNSLPRGTVRSLARSFVDSSRTRRTGELPRRRSALRLRFSFRSLSRQATAASSRATGTLLLIPPSRTLFLLVEDHEFFFRHRREIKGNIAPRHATPRRTVFYFLEREEIRFQISPREERCPTARAEPFKYSNIEEVTL